MDDQFEELGFGDDLVLHVGGIKHEDNPVCSGVVA